MCKSVTRRSAVPVAASAVLFAAVSATSAQVLYEPFNYTSGSGLSNITTNFTNNYNDGFVNQSSGIAWGTTGTADTPAIVSSPGMSFPGLPASQGLQVNANTTGVFVTRTPLGKYVTFNSIPGNTVYYSMIIEFDSLPGSFSRIAGFNNFALPQSGVASGFGGSLSTQVSSGKVQLGIATGGTASFDSNVSHLFSTGVPILVVGSYTIGGSGVSTDTSKLWIDPSSTTFGAASAPGTADATSSATSVITDALSGNPQTTLASFFLRTNTAQSPWRIDELRVDTTWAGVVPDGTLQKTWSAAGGGNWSSTGNWSGGSVANGLGHVANFGTGITTGSTITVDGGGQTVDTVNINNAGTLTIAGSPLTISTNASAGQLVTLQGSHLISAPLNLSNDLDIKTGNDSSGASLSNLTLSGAITGPGKTITKYGRGNLVMGANDIIDHNANLSSIVGTIDLNGTSQTVTDFNLGIGHLNTSAAQGGPDINPGNVIGTGGGTLNVSNQATLQSGSISVNLGGAGNVFKTTEGTATLSGASSYTGTTTVHGGILVVGADAPAGAPGALGNASSAVQLGDANSTLNELTYLLVNGSHNVGRDINVGATGSTARIGGIANNTTVTYSGTITLNGRTLQVTSNPNSTTLISGNILDTGASALTKVGSGTAFLSGTNSYNGPSTASAGTLIFNNAASLGNTSFIQASAGGAVGYASSSLDPTFIGKINTGPNSLGGLALASVDSASNVDFTNSPLNGSGTMGMSVGAIGTIIYTGTITPANNAYRLGGGGTLVLNNTSQVLMDTAGANSLQVVNGGMVILSQPNTFSGGSVTIGDASSSITTTLNINTDSTLGAAGNNITFGALGGGVLQFAGSFATARSISFGNGAATLDTNSNNVTISGSIGGSGSGALTKNGAGILQLAGSTSYTNPTAINAGTLQPGGANLLPSGSDFTVASGATFDLNGFDQNIGSLSGAGSTILNGTLTLSKTTSNSINTYSGTISGTGSLIKQSGATLALLGSNTFTGGVILDPNGNSAISPQLEINSDASLGAVPTSPAVNVTMIKSGASGQSTTLRFDAPVSLNANRTILINQTNGGGPQISTNGFNATINGSITSSTAGGTNLNKVGAGTLFLTGDNSTNSGGFFSGLIINAGAVNVSQDNNIGKTSASGTPGGITLSAGTLQFGGSFDAVNRGVTIAAVGGTIDTQANTATLSGALSNNGSGTGAFVKIGAGTLVLTGTNAYNSPTTLNAGTLQVAVPAAAATASPVIVNAGEYRMSGAGNYAPASLTINAGTAHLLAGRDKSLTLASAPVIGATGQLDLEDSAMIINYASGDTTHSVRDTIRNLLKNGRNGAAGQPGAWNGLGGITSSFAHNNGNGFNLAIGYGDNEDIALVRGSGSYTSFGGQTVSSNTVLIQMTRGADATLDGVVDAQDVTILGSHFNKPNSGQWVFGDFDYSGTCDATDVTTLGSTFGKTTPTLSPAQMTAEFGAAFTSAFEGGQAGAVPEPSGVGIILGAAAISSLRRRRRRRA